jgi:arsenical pump membrane protein
VNFPALALLLPALAVVPLAARFPMASLVPAALAGIAVATGEIDASNAARVIGELQSPVLFLVFLFPFSYLLDESGFFRSLAALAGRLKRRRLVFMYMTAAAVTAVFNLDTCIVVLTPLSVEIAGTDAELAKSYAGIPLALAAIASSWLPASNLTNLLVESRLGLNASFFLLYLALPSIGAATVGYISLRRLLGKGATRATAAGEPDGKALFIGGSCFAALLAIFSFGYLLGVKEWEALAAADVTLAIYLRKVAVRPPQLAPVLIVISIGILVTGLRAPEGALARHPGGIFLMPFVATGLCSLLNNVPATLLLSEQLRHASKSVVAATLLGTNFGVFLTPTASLAALIWLRILREKGLSPRPRDFYTVSLRVVLPAFLCATATLWITTLS